MAVEYAHCERFADSRLCSDSTPSPEATNIWPQVTENNYIPAGRPADVGFLIYSQKAKRCCSIGRALTFKGCSMSIHV